MDQSNTRDRSSEQGGTPMMQRVRNGASAQLSSQKNRATDSLGGVAQAVRQTAQPLREQQHDTMAEYAEKAAGQLERFTESLRQREIGDLVRDGERFARRQPALFISAAFAAGLIGARFLKSSSEEAHRRRQVSDWRSTGSALPRTTGTGGI